MNSKHGIFYIIGAATLWGSTGTSQALAPSGASPLAIGAFRILIGGSVLLLFALYRGGFRQRSTWDWRITLLAAVTTALYQVTFFGGIKLTGVAVGTITGIGSAPIFAGLLAWRFGGERLSSRWIIGTAMAVIGCVVLVSNGDETMVVDSQGVLLALCAGFSYAAFTLFNKRLIEQHPSDEVMAVTFCLGALILLPVLFFVPLGWVASIQGLSIILYLGIFATGLSYMLFGRGLRTVSVSTTGTLTLAEPLTATLLGVVIVGETLTPAGIIGVLCIFIGLVILTIHS